MKKIMLLVAAIALLSLSGLAQADVTNMGGELTSLQTVPVGNPGNAGETSGNGGWGGFIKENTGKVDYEYNIGKYEVTAAQYTEFLNAVAKTDTYGLYSTSMSVNGGQEGCRIERTGVSGSYVYSVRNDDPYFFANRPVTHVSWGDSARFVNWLHNGQPTGAQNITTTEDGAYFINGKTSNADLLTVSRKSGWIWALPTEDEWYKAAFYDPSKGGAGIGGYWDLPMQSDNSVTPGRDYSGSNDANWIGPPYYSYLEGYFIRSLVGQFINSPSAYGTFDQGGNVWERNETVVQMGYPSAPGAMSFGNRGSGYRSTGEHLMWAVYRDPNYLPDFEWQGIGFRVVGPITTIPPPPDMEYSDDITVDGNINDWPAAAFSPMTFAYYPNPLVNSDISNAACAFRWGAGGTKVYVALKIQDVEPVRNNSYTYWNVNDHIEAQIWASSLSGTINATCDRSQQYEFGLAINGVDSWATVTGGQTIPVAADFHHAITEGVDGWVYYEAAMTPFELFNSITGAVTPRILAVDDVIGADAVIGSKNSTANFNMLAANGMTGKSNTTLAIQNHTLARTGIQGTITLLNYGVTNKLGVEGTATITDSSSNTETHKIVLDADGLYSFTTALRGTCTVIVKCSHWLGKSASVDLGITGNGVASFSLINGDVVDNNEVDFDDINATRAAYGSFPGDDNWNEMADVDGSGEVDFTDINIVRGNYGEIGD